MSPSTTALLGALAAAVVLATSALADGEGGSVRGNPVTGKALFLRAGVFCGSCHALKAAKSTGREGNGGRKKSRNRIIVRCIHTG